MRRHKVWKKICGVFLAAMMLTMVAPSVAPVGGVIKAEAATVKLSKSKLTLEVGETYKLKMKGTKKNPTWKSSKKSVVSVSKNGNLRAKKEGKATITATIGEKTYTCKVTVVRATNPHLEDAPFEAEELYMEDVKTSVVVPAGWYMETYGETVVIAPDSDSISKIQAEIMLDEDIRADEFDEFKKVMEDIYTVEFFNEMFVALLAGEATIEVDENGVQVYEVETVAEDGRMLIVECRLVCEVAGIEFPIEWTIYDMVKDGVVYSVNAMNCGEYEGEFSLKEIAKYMAESVTLH